MSGTWRARYKTTHMTVIETRHCDILIEAKGVRSAHPRLPTDIRLQKTHGRGVQREGEGEVKALFLGEAAVRAELSAAGDHDALMLLAWMDKTLFGPAASKRGQAQDTAPMRLELGGRNTQALANGRDDDDDDDEDAQPAVQRGFLRRVWRGEASILGASLGGGLLCVVWITLVWWLIYFLTNRSSYAGNFVRLQWGVMLLVLSTLGAALWWGIGIMRSAMRRMREGAGWVGSALAFVLGMTVLLNATASTMGLAQEWLLGWWDHITDQGKPVVVIHDPILNRVVVRGEIGFGSVNALRTALALTPKLPLIQLESPGGYVIEGLAMARLIEEAKIDTVSLELCASACTFLLAAGQDRYLGPKVQVGFHRSSAAGYLPSAGWNRMDHKIAAYYKSRNASPEFVTQALDTPGNRIWIPPHAQMLDAGFANKRWEDRKNGY